MPLGAPVLCNHSVDHSDLSSFLALMEAPTPTSPPPARPASTTIASHGHSMTMLHKSLHVPVERPFHIRYAPWIARIVIQVRFREKAPFDSTGRKLSQHVACLRSPLHPASTFRTRTDRGISILINLSVHSRANHCLLQPAVLFFSSSLTSAANAGLKTGPPTHRIISSLGQAVCPFASQRNLLHSKCSSPLSNSAFSKGLDSASTYVCSRPFSHQEFSRVHLLPLARHSPSSCFPAI